MVEKLGGWCNDKGVCMVYCYGLLLCLNRIKTQNFISTSILLYDVIKPALTMQLTAGARALPIAILLCLYLSCIDRNVTCFRLSLLETTLPDKTC